MDFIGKKIVKVRAMTSAEMTKENWSLGIGIPPPVLELEDGTIIYPSMDAEGNGPGNLFGVCSPKGKDKGRMFRVVV